MAATDPRVPRVVGLLDVTLRDGSYVIDFQFTAEETVGLCRALEDAGVEWIEIGHGLGLDASSAGRGRAGAADEAYMLAAAGTLRRARWGMFFIPGIGRLESIRVARGHGMHFLRVGTNVTEVAQAAEAIGCARELGLMVSSNLMKSYAVPAEKFAAAGAAAASFGADVVCLVDSAGTMTPADVLAYLGALRERVDVAVGFHGHENLRLGTANTLEAVGAGATLIDGSLQGMGRSAGNPPTEILAILLQRVGLGKELDVDRLLDAGQRWVRPRLSQRGLDPLDLVSGECAFHSSYLPRVVACAAEHGVDPRALVRVVAGQDQVHLTEAALREAARRLRPPAVPGEAP